jgi:hypothetical protein
MATDVDAPDAQRAVVRLAGVSRVDVAALLERYGLHLELVAREQAIPASYWGDSEAGLKGDRLYVRLDTPVHSILHEAAHFVCMTPERRAGLDADAGGDHDEENAVCWLQIALAGSVGRFGRERMLRDMDEWGYTFRLGSARAWLQNDAADAERWLRERGLIDSTGAPTWRTREA